MKKSGKQINKSKLLCYVTLIIEISVIILCYIKKSLNWGKTLPIPANEAVYGLCAVLLLLFAAGFLICARFKSIAVEKKLLFIAGNTAIALGVIGFFDIVTAGNITIWDALYRTIQFFVGEFDTAGLQDGFVPPLINISRFMALGVTFGAIGVILLKNKLYHWNIRLFYQDVVIIADRHEECIDALAKRLVLRGRKVVFGYTDAVGEPISVRLVSAIPAVHIDVDTNIVQGLRACNANKARDIFLLCENTGDNVKLAKAIYAMFEHPGDTFEPENEARDRTIMPASIDDLMTHYCSLVKKKPAYIASRQTNNTDKTVCYVRYAADMEREYYAIDDVFTNRSDCFDTCFVNLYDIAIRQLLVKSTLRRAVDSRDAATLKQRLRDVNIAVAGCGDMLYRAVLEIARNCVYHDSTPLKIYHMHQEHTCGSSIPAVTRLKGLVEIEAVSAIQLKNKGVEIDQFWICSDDEKQAGAILKEIFKHGLQQRIYDCLVLAAGHAVEYDILNDIIKSLIQPYVQGEKTVGDRLSAKIHVGSVSGALMNVGAFYKRYAPAASLIHAAYTKALVNEQVQDYCKLPEMFIESSILSALHMYFMMDVLDNVIKREEKCGVENAMRVRKLLEYLAATEHERWYNERSISGCVFSEQPYRLYNSNARLVHWDELSTQQKEDNLRYVISAMIAQREKEIKAPDAYDDRITTYTL